ncbi:hypothetical protein [Xanthomonas campestris]|uniref:hypothetical protein n=1 Tax=Xanthomonas campestris TaxID=339 RepID=UPI0012901C9C|nr:hypothetical protein [Xanthomonas campestris]
MSKFTDWLKGIFRGDVSLAPAEDWLLRQFVDKLPPHLMPIVQKQIASYNRMYREVDGRAINFYCRPEISSGFPSLSMDSDEAPLIRITVSVNGADKPIHATLTAVHGRVFCMSFSQPVKHILPASMQLIKVKDAWCSNFPASASNNSFKPNPLRGSASFRR